MTKLPLELIRIDGGTQIRCETNNAAVDDYSAAIKDGIDLPPVIVFFDGAEYWLADGFHRYWSYTRAGKVSLPVTVHKGDKRAAWLYALGANDENGIRRTPEDKRNAVNAALADEELGHWSDHEVARKCRVSQPFVSKIRASLTDNVISEPRTYTTKHGTTATMKPRAPKPAAATQNASEPYQPVAQAPQAEANDPQVTDAEAPDDAEMQANALAEQADVKYLNDLISADEPTALMHAEIKRLNLEVAQLKVARDGYMRELNEYKKIAAKVQRENDRLKKSTRQT